MIKIRLGEPQNLEKALHDEDSSGEPQMIKFGKKLGVHGSYEKLVPSGNCGPATLVPNGHMKRSTKDMTDGDWRDDVETGIRLL